MKNDKLKRANELDKEINQIQYEIKKWKKVTCIARLRAENPIPIFSEIELEPKYVDFPTLKAATISSLEARLKQLKEEFELL